MKSAREELDIITAYREVGGFRGAAAICGTTHKTVKRIVERHEVGGQRPARPVRPANYEMVRELVAGKVEATHARISAKRLLPAARAAGYDGSARNFRRLVAQEKRAWRQANARTRRPAVWAPGEVLAIDWGVLGGLQVFCAVLAFSRVRFVRFAADERAETTLGLLAECFEVLGGVPKVVLADRMACLKGGLVADVVVPTPDYVRFAAHYRFRPDFCRAADPASKGIVENLVGYAETDLIPLIAALGDGQVPPADLAAANAAAAEWCAEVNGVMHSEIAAVPEQRLQAERELLGPLPSLRPSIGRVTLRKVDKLSCVRFSSARYSVPTALIGQRVALLAADGRLSIVAPGTGEVVAEHALVAPGEASVRDEHYGGPRRAPQRAARPRTAAEKAFCALGPVAEQFLIGAAAAGNTRLGPELAELAPSRRRTGDRHCWPPSAGRSRSAAGTPPTSARSWPPAPAPGSRRSAPPVTRWSSRCRHGHPAAGRLLPGHPARREPPPTDSTTTTATGAGA